MGIDESESTQYSTTDQLPSLFPRIGHGAETAMPVTPGPVLADSTAGNARFLSQRWFLPSSPLQRYVFVGTNKSSRANDVSQS